MYNDEHAGKGGSYVLDPKTGKRRLVERTSEEKVIPIPTTEQEPSDDEV